MTQSLYVHLGLEPSASNTEIKRAYRNLATKLHPDKGGDALHFKQLQTAYEVLSDKVKRAEYDSTGRITKSVEEDFADSFAGGSFRDRKQNSRDEEVETTQISERITVHREDRPVSHTAGFEAWMRARGDSATEVFTAETMAEKYGVMRGSFEEVALPADLNYQQVLCAKAGKPDEVLSLQPGRLPQALEWGEVLVNIRAAPINPADLYTAKMGGIYGSSKAALPYVAGHDCIGIVAKVGAGVKGLNVGDWVMPLKTHSGTWTQLAVWKGKDLLRLEPGFMPLEYAAMLREQCLAFRLLEEHGNLKPGDCVMLNAANSTVGQVVIQLCKILKLRVVAIVRQDDEKVVTWLRSLGASVVIPDNVSIKDELDKVKFFAKPRLALDAVGGTCAARMCDALAESGVMVCYGASSGKAPSWPWQSWVFKEQQVVGFNLRNWLTRDAARKLPRLPHMLQSLAKLVNADQLRIAYTEYDVDEFEEALSHALDTGKNTKILLLMSEYLTEQ